MLRLGDELGVRMTERGIKYLYPLKGCPLKAASVAISRAHKVGLRKRKRKAIASWRVPIHAVFGATGRVPIN